MGRTALQPRGDTLPRDATRQPYDLPVETGGGLALDLFVRLLEMLMQFKGTGWRQIDVEDFAKAMDARDSHRKNFAQLRRGIVEPAVKELTEKDGWLIEWIPLKLGRKVTALRFEFRRDPQGKLPV